MNRTHTAHESINQFQFRSGDFINELVGIVSTQQKKLLASYCSDGIVRLQCETFYI